MSLLHVTFDGVNVTPMRPEHDTKTFASADCPSGTDAVYIKAAKILVHSHGKSLDVGIPSFSDSDIESKVTARMTDLKVEGDVVPDSDPEELYEFVDGHCMDMSVINRPTDEEVQCLIDDTRGFTAADVLKKQEEAGLVNIGTEDAPEYDKYEEEDDEYLPGDDNWKYEMTRAEAASALRMKDDEGNEIADMTEQEAFNQIVDERKEGLARQQVDYLVSECCEVPTLSQDFKDQFTVVES
jgi:hypothetical protein